jgi:hypothetical protein
MRPAGRWLVAVAASSIAIAAWALPRERPSADELARCRATNAPAIELHAGSRLRADGVLETGERVGCNHSRTAARVIVSARAALELAPHHLRPERVAVHLDPALPPGSAPPGPLETHAESASLFAGRAGAADLGPSIWLHEFAHLRARGARPRGRIERRIYAAIEEGVADYYAAVFGGNARLSAAASTRDLERPPGIPAEYWVTLLAPVFDPHPFGWELGAALWKLEPRPGPLLEDLLAGLSARAEATDPTARAEATPATVAHSFTLRCPARSRPAIAKALAQAFGLEQDLERTKL